MSPRTSNSTPSSSSPQNAYPTSLLFAFQLRRDLQRLSSRFDQIDTSTKFLYTSIDRLTVTNDHLTTSTTKASQTAGHLTTRLDQLEASSKLLHTSVDKLNVSNNHLVSSNSKVSQTAGHLITTTEELAKSLESISSNTTKSLRLALTDMENSMMSNTRSGVMGVVRRVGNKLNAFKAQTEELESSLERPRDLDARLNEREEALAMSEEMSSLQEQTDSRKEHENLQDDQDVAMQAIASQIDVLGRKVSERFDEIDRRLNEISDSMTKGFNQLKEMLEHKGLTPTEDEPSHTTHAPATLSWMDPVAPGENTAATSSSTMSTNPDADNHHHHLAGPSEPASDQHSASEEPEAAKIWMALNEKEKERKRAPDGHDPVAAAVVSEAQAPASAPSPSPRRPSPLRGPAAAARGTKRERSVVGDDGNDGAGGLPPPNKKTKTAGAANKEQEREATRAERGLRPLRALRGSSKMRGD